MELKERIKSMITGGSTNVAKKIVVSKCASLLVLRFVLDIILAK